jgi:hypothetical protein
MLIPLVNLTFYWSALTTRPIEQKLGSALSSSSVVNRRRDLACRETTVIVASLKLKGLD